MKKLEIIPSIIAKSSEELQSRLKKVKLFKTVHLDVMDNKFVKNESLMFKFKLNIKNETHLMVNNPLPWIKKCLYDSGTVIVHIESCVDLEQLIKNVKNIGIALNPNTPVTKIMPYIDNIKKVLVMTVNPGFYGGKFLTNCLDKVKVLRRLYPDLDIAVDGSINPGTIKLAKDAGANQFVIGSYLQNSVDVQSCLEKLWLQIL